MTENDVNAYTIKALDNIGAFELQEWIYDNSDDSRYTMLQILMEIKGILNYHNTLMNGVKK